MTTETITPRQLAERLGYKPQYGNQLAKDGRFVFAPDGKRVLVQESIVRFNATKDPSKQGVAERHAATREAAAAPPAPAYEPEREDREPAPTSNAAGNTYQQARAVKAKFEALEAKRAYEVAIGQLRDAREVESLVATAMTELRIRLENLATTVAPVLAVEPDEVKVRVALQDHIAAAMESASHHFAQLARKPA